MTTLNIPSSPSQGATYEANGVVYTWDGTKWKADSSYVSNLNGGQLGGFRNQIINGNSLIWQRGLAVSGPGFGGDHWEMSTGNSRSLQKSNSPSLIPNAPSPYLFGWEAPSSTTMTQPIELMKTGEMAPFLPGTTWTLSFYWTGTMLPDVAFSFNDGSGSFNAGNIIVSDGTSTSLGESRYSYTFTIPSNQTIASTRNNFGVRFIKKNSSDDYITCIQLEPGPVATPFEQRPKGTEVALCQRYYIVSQFSQQTSAGATSYVGQWVPFATAMRTTPTVAITQETGRFPAGLPAPTLSQAENQGLRVSMLNNTGAAQTNISYGLIFSADAEL